ncbi:MAG TPA: hypothetical protein VH968_08970 [Gaiellaceae bacterium]
MGRIVFPGVKTIQEIRVEIERASEDRADLLHRLSAGHDVVLAKELRELDEQIAKLWDEHREARVRTRFGDRNEIIRRARLEERIDRAA